MAKASPDDIMVAIESGSAEVDGQVIVFKKGETHIERRHPLVKQIPFAFAQVEHRLTYAVAEATAEPGAKRGAAKK